MTSYRLHCIRENLRIHSSEMVRMFFIIYIMGDISKTAGKFKFSAAVLVLFCSKSLLF